MVEKKKEAETPVVAPTPVVVSPKERTDQDMKELTFRLLWQASRLTKGATGREILHEMNSLRKWVGEKRADALEKQWREGKPLPPK